MHTGWLVDMGYVVGAGGKFKLDYIKAENFLSDTCGPTSTYLFNGFDTDYGIAPGLRAFYNAMTAHGMVVRIYPMHSGAPGDNRQRGVDVDIGAHIIWQASMSDISTVVLTSGDRDLIPAVEIAHEKFDQRVVLFTYNKNVSRDLVATVDAWWHFEEHADKLARY